MILAFNEMSDDEWKEVAVNLDKACDALPDNCGLVYFAVKGKGKLDRARTYFQVHGGKYKDITGKDIADALKHLSYNAEKLDEEK